YLIEDSEYSRRAIGKYIDTWLYPDGHVELKLNGVALPYRIYDRLSQIDQGDIIDNKRLGQVLHVAMLVQEKRDNHRSRALPSVDGPDVTRSRTANKKKSQRSLNEDDMLEAIIKLQASSEAIFGKKR
ncbi:ISNCY family transposase, partial [Citrobacter portucalensis]|nr:ISNCY family transposase [Citrobacter portucalensis]